MIDINELRQKLRSDDIIDHVDIHANVKPVLTELLDRLEAAESDALEQARLSGMGASREAALMAKLEAAEKERDNANAAAAGIALQAETLQAERDALRASLKAAERNLNCCRAEREEAASLFLSAKTRLMKERDALRARIAAMEQQEPVAWRRRSDYGWSYKAKPVNGLVLEPLYLAPGAQPAPSVPEGWKLVPIEPTEKMISDGSCASSLPGPHYISEDCAKQCWEYMLAATPEAKP